MFIVGVDENGLGPRLGPLVATAVTLEVEKYRKSALYAFGESIGICDSKVSSGFGRMAAVEGIVLALIDSLYGECPREVDRLFDLVSLDGLLQLRTACPRNSAPQCWKVPVALPVFGGQVEQGRTVLRKLSRTGIRIRSVRSAITCARVLNTAVKRMGSKFSVDLSLFERLLLCARALLNEDFEAYCGMVGGIRKYPRYFQHFTQSQIETVKEVRSHSIYRISELGLVTFEVDADAHHMPVGLASMLGKYIRELAMERQNQFYLNHEPSLRRVSGYHDPITARFVQQTIKLRDRLRISQECFER